MLVSFPGGESQAEEGSNKVDQVLHSSPGNGGYTLLKAGAIMRQEQKESKEYQCVVSAQRKQEEGKTRK